MKSYSIGRENGCDIVINDNTDVISRRHAVLTVSSSGKMTITDQSHNGTYVNGIRISQNVPFPVTRKDNVSFAHIARLDWNLIPKPMSPMLYAAMAVVLLLAIVACVYGFNQFGGGDNGNNGASVPPQKTEEQIRKDVADSLTRVKAREDSLMKAKDDSVKKVENAKKDSIQKAKNNKSKKTQPAKTDSVKVQPKTTFR